jgi:hypothetical protein
MRQPPSPGTFKVTPRKDGGFVLAGVRQDGTKHRVKVQTLTEGHTLGRSLFQGLTMPQPGGVTLPNVDVAKDEFGLPVGFKLPQVSAETISSAAPSPAPPAPAPLPLTPRQSNAKSLMELFGIAGAAAPVYLANKYLEPRYETVPKPSKKQMNDLADEIKLALQESFGDREVGHWTMAFLLAIGIPVSMWIQASGPKKLKAEATPNLQSVP